MKKPKSLPLILKITTHIPIAPNHPPPDLTLKYVKLNSAGFSNSLHYGTTKESRSTSDSSIIGWWKCPKIKTSTSISFAR
ncbi:MAG: hypothetical protein Q7J10_08765 [Methanosarcinaceae archaeon]|nr:hypothetical protein [Methanosarcinaceae archaeon]